MLAKRCKSCGQRFTNDAAFCPFDGESLEQDGSWDSVSDPLIGSVVDGRYEIQAALGEGGMGTVYRARHKAIGRVFAMKVLRQDLAREGELCARFIQEARAAATINHPNVVQITDYGTLPNATPYFVMEYLDGVSLSKLLRNGGPLPAARAVRLLLQIATGVGAAHRCGIVHRDLKPDNIIVIEESGREIVKILDFGVAKIAGSASMTRAGMVFGSPHYMSPEQASGQPVDHRADIYALGIIMYEMFTGRVPFEADTFMGVLTKHMFMEPERFSAKIGPACELGALEDITLRCLEKKPDNRFPTTEALAAAVEEVVQLGAGDDIGIRQSSAGSARNPMATFRLADELEPPRSYEISAARGLRSAADQRTRLAIVAMVAAFLLFVGALVTLIVVRSGASAAASASSVASVQSVPPIQSAAAVQSVATAEAVRVLSPPAAAVVAAPVSSGDHVAAAPTTAATPTVNRPGPQKKPRTPVDPNPSPPATKATSGGSDIVNPWN